jgi:hypothetical protein
VDIGIDVNRQQSWVEKEKVELSDIVVVSIEVIPSRPNNGNRRLSLWKRDHGRNSVNADGKNCKIHPYIQLNC